MNEKDMSNQGTGALESPHDYRYVNMEHLAGAAPETTPTSFHIDFSNVPDLYQRKIGACTTHAAAEMRIAREIRLKGQLKRYSPRFTYAMAKTTDGLPADEQGTYTVMPFKIGVKFGFATEDTVPNDTTLDFNAYVYNRDIRKIPEAAFKEAADNRIPGYVQIGSFNAITESQIKQGLMHSLDGVKTCLPVGKEWYTAKNGQSSWLSKDILPIRKCIDPVSGHDIVITGWELETNTGRTKIFFRNHWSLQWADQDNGWFYLDDHQLREAWVISDIPDPILAIIKSLPAEKDFSYTWKTDIAPGTQHPDVRNLQIALKIIGTFPFPQPVTDYFGNITRSAVMDFQTQYKVASPAEIAAAGGKLGPKTREVLNKMFSHK